ncbi:MAG: thiamine-phosphate kinase [Candidatus Goldbacteria bacterium]|nr:thiamine-phosphate kinase [Candidatus Goldiibacteriota bacterium]
MREQQFISFIKQNSTILNDNIIKSIGDDCAVMKSIPDKYFLITTDALCEKNHFDRRYFYPEEIGAKAIAVNISDICAMGGIPAHCLISIGFNKKEKQKFINRIYNGIISYSKNYGIDIIGGDTVGSNTLFISVVLIGFIKKQNILYRSGAKPGDSIYVTGFLGDSAAGLDVLLKKGRKNLKTYEYFPIKKHLVPTPKYVESRVLSESKLVNCCIDISDGLINDLMNITYENKYGAEIWTDRIPISFSTMNIAKQYKKNPLDYALYGGEDYELLFTVSSKNNKKFFDYIKKNGLNVFEIGKIINKREIILNENGKKRKPELKKIWNHFV